MGLSFAQFFLLILSFSFISTSFSDSKIKFTNDYLDSIEQEYGDYAKRRLVSWVKLMDEAKDLSEDEKLKQVNAFFNMLTFRSDISHWGDKDYWATPLELLVSGAGDCEDYSIAKYFTLLQLGVADERMLITYVKAVEINEAHMVLTYYEKPSAIPLVLDNLIGEIKTADKRPDLVPVYSFNGTGLWQAKQRGLGRKIGESDDLKRWSDLEERMNKGIIRKFR